MEMMIRRPQCKIATKSCLKNVLKEGESHLNLIPYVVGGGYEGKDLGKVVQYCKDTAKNTCECANGDMKKVEELSEMFNAECNYTQMTCTEALDCGNAIINRKEKGW